MTCTQSVKKTFSAKKTCTDEKENLIFLIHKEIQNGAVAKHEEGLPDIRGMRKYLNIYEEAVGHILLCNCSILNFLIYEENLIFSFISVRLI
jgi:hypothetical protein